MCRSTGGARPRPSGRYVVYGVSRNGSEDSLLRVLVVADGSVLPEEHSQYRGRQSALARRRQRLLYNQLTGKVATPERPSSTGLALAPPSRHRSHRRSRDHEARSHRRRRVRENTITLCGDLPRIQVRRPHAERRSPGDARLHCAARRCHRGRGALDCVCKLRGRGHRLRTRRRGSVRAGEQRHAARTPGQDIRVCTQSRDGSHRRSSRCRRHRGYRARAQRHLSAHHGWRHQPPTMRAPRRPGRRDCRCPSKAPWVRSSPRAATRTAP